MKCAICVIGFNRPDHLDSTLKSLYAAISGFESKNIMYSVLGYLDSLDNDGNYSIPVKTVFEKYNVDINIREKNYGLRNNILTILKEIKKSSFDCFIILEDDIKISTKTLSYFELMFNKYEYDSNVLQISAFSPIDINKSISVFRHGRLSTWCWGSWVTKFPEVSTFEIDWMHFDVDEWFKRNAYYLSLSPDVVNIMKAQSYGNVSAWSLDLLVYMFKMGLSTIYPTKSFVLNIGHDGTGINCGNRRLFKTQKNSEIQILFDNLNTTECWDFELFKEFKSFYSPNIFMKLKRYIGL